MRCKNNVFLVFKMLFLNVCLLIADNNTLNFSGKKNQEPTKAEKLFKAGFLETRLQHIEALKHIRKTMNYEKQYKLTYQVFQKLFDVLKTSKVSLENSDYVPGLDFPTNQTVIEAASQLIFVPTLFLFSQFGRCFLDVGFRQITALAQLLDNTALYSEFQLKMPDITDRIMKTHNEWMILIKWALFFSNSTGLFDAKTSTLLNLVCQEMNLIERGESYVNPYRISESEASSLKQKELPPKKKKIFKKGPRMSKPFYNEL